jgi:superfamily II DNA or RNA helicase
MILLHLGLLDGELVLFGEAPLERALRGRVQNYPFDAGVKGLEFALEQIGVQPRRGSGSHLAGLLWVPTLGEYAIPSSALISDNAVLRGETVVKPWRITLRPLDIAAAAKLLYACAGKRSVAPGVVVGDDVAYWLDVVRYAASLVARQRYLPGVGAEKRAAWESVVRDQDGEIFARLVRDMPVVSRALTTPNATSPPARSRAALLRQFLDCAAEQFVRHTAVAVPAPEKLEKSSWRDEEEFEDGGVHDAWLDALDADDPEIDASDGEVRALEAQVSQWRRRLSAGVASTVRLCLRLEPPEEHAATAQATGRGWYVRYLVQPHADQSLLIPIQDALNAGARRVLNLPGTNAEWRESILSWLGQAASIAPEIADSLAEREVAGCWLDDHGAHQFLTGHSLALEQAGFAVLLPSWWASGPHRPQIEIRVRAKSPPMHGTGTLTLGQLVEFDWEVALGDDVLSSSELEELAAKSAPLVRLRGKWVEIDPARVAAAIDYQRKSTGTMTLRELLKLATAGRLEDRTVDFGGVRASGWVRELLDRLMDHAVLETLDAPSGFHGELRPYQVRGFSWLAFLRRFGLGACLADDMGLGKTVQALAHIQREREYGEIRPVLLVCPTSVVNNWRREAERFTPSLSILVHHGVSRSRGDVFIEVAKQHALILSSYSLLQRDLEFLERVQFAGVILDEAQNIKNSETKQARAAKALTADYRAALTGTPVENNVGDLWSLMDFLNPGLLGTQSEFRRTYFVPIQHEGNAEATSRLRKITQPFVLRRLKTDRDVIADLPEKHEMKVYCSLTREQAALYEAVLRETEVALDAASGIGRRGLILATLTRLKQICNHPAHYLGEKTPPAAERSGKLARVSEMLEEVIEVGDRALVFSQYAEMGTLLKQHLEEQYGREVLFLHGAVPKKKRDEMVERFQSAEDGPPIFLLSLKAGGFGLNLTRANHVFHFDRWWNPAVEEQATDRAFRIGQSRNVQVHKLVCAGTLEEKIDDLIEKKRAVAQTVVSGGEQWLTELSNDELRDIIALRPDAVGD